MISSLKKIRGDKKGWYKVSDLVAGMEIAVLGDVSQTQGNVRHGDGGTMGQGYERTPSTGRQNRQGDDDILWDEIVSIKHVGREQVWDIEVKGTHNFVGNDIFAHNTYIGQALSATASQSSFAQGSGGTQSFAERFFSNIFTRITAWLADAGNGIGNIFAKVISSEIVYTREIHTNQVDTKELCISDESGAKTCITKAQFDAFLAGAAAAGVNTAPTAGSDSGNAGGESVGASSESPQDSANPAPPAYGGTESSTPVAETPAPETTPTAEPAPTETSATPEPPPADSADAPVPEPEETPTALPENALAPELAATSAETAAATAE